MGSPRMARIYLYYYGIMALPARTAWRSCTSSMSGDVLRLIPHPALHRALGTRRDLLRNGPRLPTEI